VATWVSDTGERARYANRVIWPAPAMVRERAEWGSRIWRKWSAGSVALDAASHIVRC
jgi:hypothetical protein